MPDHEPRTTNLTLTAGEFAALHEQVLSDGGRAAEDVLDPCRRAALAELVAWLPDLTAEAYDDAIIPCGRRTLPAAGAWLADAALGHDDPQGTADARARAADLARARLAARSAHDRAEPPTESVQKCACSLARALEPSLAPAERRELIAAVHAELLILAVLRTQPTSSPAPTGSGPLTSQPRWSARGAARAVLQCADATQPRSGSLLTRVAFAEQTDAAGRFGLAAIVGALPALALDAIWLDAGGAGLDARASRERLEHAHARAEAGLFHAFCALEEVGLPAMRQCSAITNTGWQRLVEIVDGADGSPLLVAIDRCAHSLADALTAGPADELAPSLWIVAGELAAVAALTNAGLRSGAASRHIVSLRRATRRRGGPRRR